MSQPENTIPPPLRETLDILRTRPVYISHQNTIYEVIEATTSAYMDTSMKVVGSYSDLREANEAAARHFVNGGLLAARLDSPDIRINERNKISCGTATDESMGGYMKVYVRTFVW
jgi:hypothetical protein